MSKAVEIEINKKEIFKHKLKGENAYHALREINQARLILRSAETEIVRSVWPEYNGLWHHLGDWKCTGPVGVCVYDHFEDPPHDHCLFCGDPEERK